jgi:hypothetical protein
LLPCGHRKWRQECGEFPAGISGISLSAAAIWEVRSGWNQHIGRGPRQVDRIGEPLRRARSVINPT